MSIQEAYNQWSATYDTDENLTRDLDRDVTRKTLSNLRNDMDQKRIRRNTKVLWAMVVLAILYGSLMRFLPAPVGSDWVPGSLGVLLGLYICSHPAANAVDILFFQHGAVRQLSHEWSGIGWLALNLLALLAGWLVIVIGTTRLVGRIV